MAETCIRQSALAELGLTARIDEADQNAKVRLIEGSMRGQIVLRGGNDSDAVAFDAAVADILGIAPPRSKPCTSVCSQHNRILWMGPNEWLVIVADGAQATVESALRRKLADIHCAIADVSHSRSVIVLAGRRAREVLMKGCALNFHPRAFGIDSCAQSHLARCHVLIHQITAEPAYEIYIHRSFARYAFHWLQDAAREYDSEP